MQENQKIPVCPVMSAGNDIPIICVQDRCAWYFSNLKKCSVYILGHDAMQKVKDRMEKQKQTV